MSKLQLTRIEIETRLERGLVGKVVQFTDVHNEEVVGKLERLSVETDTTSRELMVTVFISHKKYTVDLVYFVENTIIHGTTSGSDQRSIRRILKGD